MRARHGGAGRRGAVSVIRANLPVRGDGGRREADAPEGFLFIGGINAHRRLCSGFCPVSALFLPYSPL